MRGVSIFDTISDLLKASCVLSLKDVSFNKKLIWMTLFLTLGDVAYWT